MATTVEPDFQQRSRRILRVGFSMRRHRVLRALEHVRHDLRTERPDLTADEVEVIAQERVAELNTAHPHALRHFLRTAPTSRAPDRRKVVDLVEVAAVLRTPEMRGIGSLLRTAPRGRRSDRRLPFAIFAANVLDSGRPEVKRYHQDFFGSNRLLDWAYGEPVIAGGAQGQSLSATYDTTKAMLKRHDPRALREANIRTLRSLARTHPEIGRYCVIDGTAIEADLDQRQSINGAEEALIVGSMVNATFGLHQGEQGVRKAWRGYTALVITDIKSTLPIAWRLIPANQREFTGVKSILDELFDLWPDCPIEYLVSDREFSQDRRLSQDLEFRYAIHPGFPLRGDTFAGQWGSSVGVPRCAAHGLMKLWQTDDFFSVRQRQMHGPRRGELTAAETAARIRWRCTDPDCRTRPVYTRVRDDARLYTYLPHRGEHARVGLREALMCRRNSGEAVNAVLKGRGVGLPGQRHPKWISSDREMEWLVGGALLGMTLRRSVHESGAYERALAEATSLHLLKTKP